MPDTPYSETEALLFAMHATETGDNSELDAYLREQFLPGELRTLEGAADLLSRRASAARRFVAGDPAPG